MADTIDIVVNAVDNFSGVLGNFGSIMTGLESTIHLVAGAFKDVYDFGAQFVEAASASEQAVTKLNVVLNSTGDSSGYSSKQLQDMAVSMQNLSGFSDEAEMSAEAMLLRFENLNDIFPEALKLTNDLAVSLGINLTTAAQTIGKALDDPASGIGRLNTQFKLFDSTQMDAIKHMAELGDVAGAQQIIMEVLRQKVGGAADAFGNTFAGSVAIAKERLDNMKELIGGPFLGVLEQLLDYFNSTVLTDLENSPLIKFLGVVNDKMQNGAPIAQAFGAALIEASDKSSPFATVMHDLGVSFLIFQTALDQLQDPLAAFQKSIEYLSGSGGLVGTLATEILKLGDAFSVGGLLPAIDTFFADIFNAMRKSIGNWVDNGGPQELSDELTSWINGLSSNPQFQSDAIVAADKLVNAIAYALGQAKWELISTAIDQKLATTIANHDWVSSGDAFGDAVVKFITTGWGQGVDKSQSSAVSSLSNSIKLWFEGAVGSVYFEHPAADIVAHFLNMLIEKLNLPSVSDLLGGTIYGMILASFQSVVQQIQNGTYLNNLGQAIVNLVRGAITIAGSQLADYISIGEQIVAGIIVGIVGYFDNLYASFRLGIELLILQVKAWLGIASPSTVFAGIGEDIVKGLINGITGMANWALSAIKSWLSEVLAPFKSVLDFLGIDTSGIFGTTSTGSTGNHDTGTTTTPGGGTTTGSTGNVYNYYIQTAYFNSNAPDPNGYDCPSPNLITGSTGNHLVTAGY